MKAHQEAAIAELARVCSRALASFASAFTSPTLSEDHTRVLRRFDALLTGDVQATDREAVLLGWLMEQVQPETLRRNFRSRMWQGSREYGPIELQGDPRDFRVEAIEEVLDAAAYTIFETLREEDRAPKGVGG